MMTLLVILVLSLIVIGIAAFLLDALGDIFEFFFDVIGAFFNFIFSLVGWGGRDRRRDRTTRTTRRSRSSWGDSDGGFDSDD